MVVVSVGSTLPQQRELDASVIAQCDLIVCDTPDEVVSQSGDMLGARAKGIEFDAKVLSLNRLVRGEIGKDAKLPLFKSVGSALQDIVAAELVYELAIREGFATGLPISFTYKQ